MKSLDKKKEYINKKDIIKYKIPVDKNFLKMFKDDDIFEITKPESLDKKKPKELDFNDKLYDIWFESLCNGNYQMFQKKIKEMFTQQRTELLEEIRELIDSCYWIVGTNYVVNGKQEKMISKSEIIEKFTNLLNKKDE